MKSVIFVLGSLAFLAISTGCNKNTGEDDLIVPANYDDSNFERNTIIEEALRSQLSAFAKKAREGRTTGLIVDAGELAALFTSGTPSLRDITTNYYAGRVDEWIIELNKASGNIYSIESRDGEGGVIGGYLMDENGLELMQMVDKGLYGAAMFNHAVGLTEGGNITPAIVDQMVKIFGAHPDFPNTNNRLTAANPDKFLANYTARRDKNDGQGLYTQIKTAFITLQAALQAGDQFNEERDAALEDVMELWEKANAATIINYCHQTVDKLSETNLSDDQIGSGLHAYSEAVAFLHGWRTIPANHKMITDAEIELLLIKLNAPYDNDATSYKLATEAVTELPKVQQVIEDLQAIYGFTDQEIEDFKQNWVLAQGR